MKFLRTSILGVLVFVSTFIIQSTNAHAYLVKIGDSTTCAFQCAEKVSCAKGFTNHFETACMGKTSDCSKLAQASCGKGLKWVHQGPMDLNLDIAEVSDSTGNKFSGIEAEKQLNLLYYDMPIEGK